MSAHAKPGVTPPGDSAAAVRRITLLSVAAAAVLILAKAIAFAASGSVALLASLADSGLDLVASLATFFAVRYAAAPPDAEHRFGHGKAEAFASLFQAALVFASAALVGREAVDRLLHPQPVEQGAAAIAVMIFSILVTGLLVQAQSRALRTAGSLAVKGDRAHYMADLASNLAAAVGIAGAAFMGWAAADAVAGLFVAAWLIWGAVGVLREASTHLMDQELNAESRQRVVALALEDPRLLGVHQLRTRASGPYVHIQMHADLDPALTLEAAHAIMIAAEKRILTAFPAADILIHPDPRGRAEPHGGLFGEAESNPETETRR
jgi:cation diffusion facilitator family transporter